MLCYMICYTTPYRVFNIDTDPTSLVPFALRYQPPFSTVRTQIALADLRVNGAEANKNQPMKIDESR